MLQRDRVWKSQRACAAAGDMRIKSKSEQLFCLTLMMVITVIV